MVILALCCAVLGLLVGSFLNVVIWRVPRGESVVDAAVALPGLRRAGAATATTSRSSAGCCCAAGAVTAARRISAALPARRGSRRPRSSSCWRCPSALEPRAARVPVPRRDRRGAGLIDIDVKRLPNAIVLPSYAVAAVLLGAAALADGAVGRPAARGPRHGRAVRASTSCSRSSTPPAWASATSSSPASSASTWAGSGWAELVDGRLPGVPARRRRRAARLMALRRAGRKSQIPFGPFMLAGALRGRPLRRRFGRLLPRHRRSADADRLKPRRPDPADPLS